MVRRTKSFGTLAALFCILLISANPAVATDVAERSQVAQTEMRSTGISWQPVIDFKSAVLTVSGPDGFFSSREFLRGDSLQIRAVDKRGTALVDGEYTWELSFSPVLEPAVKRALRDARESGDERVVAELKRQGKLPEGAVISGFFRVAFGSIITPDKAEARTAVEETSSVADRGDAGTANVESADKDQQILDDLIVDGSLCVGFDCVNGESFGFDTIRLKENNIRIKAQDTSTSASFPSRDWQITFNDTSNGGKNKFAIDDIDGSRTPFTIEAGARTNALYVEDGGRVGIGTATPVADLHVKTGNTPTLRLEQDGSSGFGAQTWDVAGNEANFFIRDASNGSTLPFRIFPGAPSNALTIEASTGDIGMGTTSPGAPLHVLMSGTSFSPLAGTPMVIQRSGSANDWAGLTAIAGTNGSGQVNFGDSSDEFQGRIIYLINNDKMDFYTNSALGMTLDSTHNLTVVGDINSTGTTVVPDYVFSPDYSLMSINELEAFITKERHLPGIPSAAEIEEQGSINISKMQMQLLAKIEELTLYTVAQQKIIDELEEAHIDAEQLNTTILKLQDRLEKLENGPID